MELGGIRGFGANMWAKVYGDRQLMRNLDKLARRTGELEIHKALMAASGPIAILARSLAPKGDSGLLQKSIKARRARPKHRGSRLVVVGPTHMKRLVYRSGRGTLKGAGGYKTEKQRTRLARNTMMGRKIIPVDPGNYGHFVEAGRPEVRPKKASAMITREGVFIGKTAKAVPEREFMRPAFAARQQLARRIFRKRLWKGIKEQAAKLPKTRRCRKHV